MKEEINVAAQMLPPEMNCSVFSATFPLRKEFTKVCHQIYMTFSVLFCDAENVLFKLEYCAVKFVLDRE